jgi:hypothetical protein
MRSFGASPAHEGLWLAQKMAPQASNNAMVLWDVPGEIDASLMARSLKLALAGAKTLLVNFRDHSEGLRQISREVGDWSPFFLDVSTEDDPEEAARAFMAHQVGEHFDLEQDLLVRLGLIKVGASSYLVAVVWHHLVSDGFGAINLLSHRIAEVYTALKQGHTVPEWEEASDPEAVYRASAGYLNSVDHDADGEFWRNYLADAPPPARVPSVDLSRSMVDELTAPAGREDRWSWLAETIGVVSRTLTVSRAELDGWSSAADAIGIRISSLLGAAASVFFRRRCDLPEFMLTMAVQNRFGSAKSAPGLMMNMVPLRIEVPLSSSFADFALAVAHEKRTVFPHSSYHLSEIQRDVGLSGSIRSQFGVVFNVIQFIEELDFAGTKATCIAGSWGIWSTS